MLHRRIRFSTLGCVLLAALSSTTPAHALPTSAVPLAATAAGATVEVIIEGHIIGRFTELVSVSAGQDPGAAKGSRQFTAVMRRQASSNIEFSAWTELGFTEPAAAKKEVVLAVLMGGDPKLRFVMTKAYPTKIEYTTVPKSDVVMETVTMTGELIRRTAV